MKKLLLILSLVLFSSAAFAQDDGFYLGFVNTNPVPEDSSADVTGKSGFELGYTNVKDIGFPVYLRTGIGLTQRGYKYEIGSSTITSTELLLEVPLTVLYDFGDLVAGFIGPTLQYRLIDPCSGSGLFCTALDENAQDFGVGLEFGLNVAISNDYVAEAYYETLVVDFYEGLSWNALGARFIWMFD